MTRLERRSLLAGAAPPLFAVGTGPVRAAAFGLRLANSSPATQAGADRIRAAANGSTAIDLCTLS